MQLKTKSILIGVATFVLGFGVFFVGALLTKAFWFNSAVQYPMIETPSIFYGDMLLLPLFNGLFFYLYSKHKPFPKNNSIWLIAIFLLSLVVNGYQNWLWTHDAYTGLIDTSYGKLNFVGWWHLVFSIVEFVIIGLFVRNWYLYRKQKSTSAYRLALKTWVVIVLFSALSIFDKAMPTSAKYSFAQLKTFYVAVLILVVAYFFRPEYNKNN